MAEHPSAGRPGDASRGMTDEERRTVALAMVGGDDQALADHDQALSDADQSLSDTDQTLSSTDRTAADDDEGEVMVVVVAGKSPGGELNDAVTSPDTGFAGVPIRVSR